MGHQNSVLYDLLKHVPWASFDRLVGQYGADQRMRRLSTKGQFIALLYGQLSGASSLREIVGGLESHSARLYHLGARPAQRSTLAETNAYRPSGIFADLFAEMVGRAHRGRGHLCLRPWPFDYGWWAKMNAAGCRIGLLPRRQAKNRKNPFGDPVREVRVKIETGKILRILSNDLNASAQEIADLYKRRWGIELFFRWAQIEFMWAAP